MDRARQLVLLDRIMAHRQAGTTDLVPASYRQPVEQYVSPSRAAAERDRLFRATPVLACLTADLAKPGDYLTLTVGDIPVVLTRASDGVVRAFRNVCRHRGAQVASGRGSAGKVLTCPYHNWSYRLDGSLAAVTSRQGFDDVDKSCMGLSPVAAAEAHGMVFVRLEGSEPIDVESWLGGIQEELSGFGLERYHHVETRSNARRINWKLTFDTFCEVYHIQALHRATIAPLIMSSATLFDAYGPHCRVLAPRWSIDELDEKPRESWDLLSHATLIYLMAPNSVFVYQQDHAELWQIFPTEDPDHSTMLIHLYAPEEPTTEKARTYWRKNMDLLMQVTDTEDFIMCEQIQSSFKSGAQESIVFGRNEPGLIHYHRSLDQLLAGETPGKAPGESPAPGETVVQAADRSSTTDHALAAGS
jgi:phenylpropionate dioxygenase-like ring-hydroxylating dioxygenase large terminal subunit